MTDTDVSDSLAPIRDRFLRVLKDREAVIVNAVEVATRDPRAAQGALRQIEAELHKIAGTAGTLGYTTFGDRARATEYRIIAHCGGDGSRADHLYLEIIDLLEMSMGLSGKAA